MVVSVACCSAHWLSAANAGSAASTNASNIFFVIRFRLELHRHRQKSGPKGASVTTATGRARRRCRGPFPLVLLIERHNAEIGVAIIPGRESGHDLMETDGAARFGARHSGRANA